MGLLKGTSVYLIGQIDHAEDPRSWRRGIAKNLLSPMGVRIYDPLIKPFWLLEEIHGIMPPQWAKDLNPSEDFKVFKDFLTSPEEWSASAKPAIINRMNFIRKLCMRMAASCDFIIGSIPKKFTVGTMEELGFAAKCGKPILLYLPDGMDTSTWLPAQIGRNFFKNSFTTMNELYDRVRSVDSGDADVDNLDWIFLSYFNDEVIKNEFPDHKQARGQSTRR